MCWLFVVVKSPLPPNAWQRYKGCDLSVVQVFHREKNLKKV